MNSLESKKIIRNPKLAWQEVEDNIVVVTPWNKQIHIIHGSSACIWDALKDPRSESDLVSLVADEFEVEEKEAREDIKKFVKDLLIKEIVQLAK